MSWKFYLFIFFYINNSNEIHLLLQRVNRAPPENTSELFSPMTFQICVGTPSQCLNVGYDTGSYTTWLPDEEIYYQNYFDSTASSTYQQKPFQLFTCETETSIEGNEFIDLVKLPSISEKTFYFNMIHANNYKNKLLSADGNAGFARLYIDDPTKEIFSNEMKRFSFVEYLFNVNHIDKKLFYHRYFNDTHGELIIGEDLDLKMNEKMYYCNCVKDEVLPKIVDNFWNCKLDKLTINDVDEDVTNIIAVFSTGEKYINCPYQIGVEIMEKYKIENPNSCSIKNLNEKESIMECDEINIQKLPNFKLKFGDYTIQLDGKNMFFKEKKKYIFAVKASSTLSWIILGDPIMKVQNFVFDADKDRVGFIESKLIQKNMVMFYLLWGILGFCVIAILFFALSSFIRYRNRVKLEQEIKNMEKSYSVNEMGIQNEITSNYAPLN